MTDKISLAEASEALQEALQDTVRRNAWLFLIQAVLLVIAGIFVIVYPLFSSMALALLLGWVLIAVGVFHLISLIGSTKVPHFWLQLVSAALAIVVGFLFVSNPGVAVGTLVLLMIVFFMIEGVSKIVFSLTIRPFPHWGWVLASGILGVLISAYLLASPGLSVLMLAILIGIQLIGQGIAIGTMAWRARGKEEKKDIQPSAAS